MRDFQAMFGDLVIDALAWEVRLNGEVVDLTRTEFEILVVLASRPRQVISDQELTRAIWGDGWFGDENNLAVHVSKLRHKLGESGLRPRFIRTIRGVGYRFDPGPGFAVPMPGRASPCDALLVRHDAIDVRVDGQLRVKTIEPMDAPVLGHDPHRLLGRYFPVLDGDPWSHHDSARGAVRILIASGVREWTARHRVRRADGSRVWADCATCLQVDGDGELQELRFVLVESDSLDGGGGVSRISDIEPVRA